MDRIRNSLGTPAYEDEDVAIYQGEALALLERLPESVIPLTVTSPPYNIGKEYEAVRPIAEYIDWCSRWMDLLHRATSPNGAFWLNVGYVGIPRQGKAVPLPYLLWNRVRFYLVQEIVWNYGAGVAGRYFFSPRNEKLLWYVKDSSDYTFNLDAVRDPNVKYPLQKKNGKLKCNPLGKNPTDVWQIPKVTSGRNRSSKERTSHPAQFPVALIERIIRACSLPGQVVFDPFVGSGTVAEAAIRAGRKSVGFEIDRKYVQVAVERLKKIRRDQSAERAQPSLFENSTTS